MRNWSKVFKPNPPSDVDLVCDLLKSNDDGWEKNAYRFEHRKLCVDVWIANGQSSVTLSIRNIELNLTKQEKKQLWDACQNYGRGNFAQSVVDYLTAKKGNLS